LPEKFVTEEWSTYFADGAVRQAIDIAGGWKGDCRKSSTLFQHANGTVGIVYANLAIINPQAAYNFFTQPHFDWGWIDGGASLTWYIAYSALLGGAGL
jgi:endo-1,3(4)-beta-glucanase